MLFGLVILLLLPTAEAYVENVTHGYVNCMACHISPNGGGVLNDYGRSLSKELMSRYGFEGSEKPAFGLIENTENIKIGGHFRSIQTHLKNDQIKQGRGFIMQQNVEVAAKYMNMWIVATAGTREGPKSTPKKDEFLSERHYILWDVSDEVKLRAGKFRQHFGINDPVHTRLTKAPLGFGSNSETYQIEFSKFSETDEIFISSSFGKLEQSHNQLTEKSFSVNYARYTSEKSKLGSSVLFGETGNDKRQLFGIYGIFAPIAESFTKFEIDFEQKYRSNQAKERVDLLAATASIGYQGVKGFWPYLISEYIQRDLDLTSTRSNSYGLGLQLFPLPHLEFHLEYQRRTDRSSRKINSDFAWALFHFYL